MKKPKILLIRHQNSVQINTRVPAAVNKVIGVFPPLGIAYIAANLLKHGYEVKILDLQALNLTSEESKQAILKEKADIVGITTMTSIFDVTREIAKYAKESESIVVIGGPQVSAFPKETVDFDYMDYAINGEAEEAFVELVKAIEHRKPVEDIRGLVYKKDGKIHTNGTVIIEDLDKIPLPAWDLLDVKKYNCIIAKKPFITMVTSRGCPYQCGFCFKLPSDKKARRHSPKKIVDDIEYCIKKFGIKEVMFYDDTFSLSREHVEGICNEIIKRNLKIKWEAPTRLNYVDEELMKLMKKSGCIRLRFGVESGDERVLKLMKKGITKDMARKVFKIAKKVKIEQFAYFIIGYYSDTPESIRSTINFAKELNPDWILFTAATPYPKTELHDQCVSCGCIDKDYWIKFIKGQSGAKMEYPVPDTNKWVRKAYFKFYFRPSCILKKFRNMNSLLEFTDYVKGAISIFFLARK